ncbi:flagellar hook protein FlgE [Burkholderia sp. L27(2015)]|uniref:flagellar hook protein FlgE n=1 Tax=Burkholderia sp. L27(2015) TaxID=1641858 RepID=UPI00131CCA21|nr:flagellar hook protein FlgE [Burkholderia sp. L27(2015)]
MGYEQGLSGLDAASTNLDVIGNNIANSSTVGFKEGSAEFASVFANSLAQSSNNQVGIGVQVSGIETSFTQGDIATSPNSLDIAINGGGFYEMQDAGQTVFTRNGQFTTDKNGFIVDASGAQLMGFPVNSAGVATSGTLQPLQIPQANIPPQISTFVKAQFNLDSGDTVPVDTPFSPTDPASFNNQSGVTAFDSLGNQENLSLFFVKGAVAGTWNVYASDNGNTLLPSQGTGPVTFTGAAADFPATVAGASGAININGVNVTIPATGTAPAATVTAAAAATAINSTPGTGVSASVDAAGDLVLTALPPTTPAAVITVGGADSGALFGAATTQAGTAAPAGLVGTATFNTNGTLTGFANVSGAVAATAGAVQISIPDSTGAGTPLSLSLNLTGTTQFGGAFSENGLDTDGFATGVLTGNTTSASGLIEGIYSNGQQLALGQIALATFGDVNALSAIGNNFYVQTNASGQPIIGVPGDTNLGSLESNATESSNVDLTTQLVDLITAQRDYQANAQTIKTQQTVDQTLFQL